VLQACIGLGSIPPSLDGSAFSKSEPFAGNVGSGPFDLPRTRNDSGRNTGGIKLVKKQRFYRIKCVKR